LLFSLFPFLLSFVMKINLNSYFPFQRKMPTTEKMFPSSGPFCPPASAFPPTPAAATAMFHSLATSGLSPAQQLALALQHHQQQQIAQLGHGHQQRLPQPFGLAQLMLASAAQQQQSAALAMYGNSAQQRLETANLLANKSFNGQNASTMNNGGKYKVLNKIYLKLDYC
jgi:hypothetical protein